jgi:hypothetical protein
MYGDVAPRKRKPVFELPEGYDNEAEFLREMRTHYDDDVGADRLNRDAAVEDLRFATGDQWTDEVRARRDAARKPTLTFNRLPAFIAQIVGQRRMNETTIKIVADQNSDHAVARVREDLVRNIQKVRAPTWPTTTRCRTRSSAGSATSRSAWTTPRRTCGSRTSASTRAQIPCQWSGTA